MLSTDLSSPRRSRVVRRGFLIVVFAVVVLGLANLWGVRSRTVTARSSRDGGYQLEVHYAQVARAGLGVPLELTVTHPGGFTQPVRIAMPSDYLALFDRNSIDPVPSSSTSSDNDVTWEFVPPAGDTLTVSFDVTVQNGRHWGRSGWAAVVGPGGRHLVSATFHTWLVP